MSTTPMPTRPGEPADPQLRDRYLRDAHTARLDRRTESARLAAEAPPSRTPSGPIWVVAALVSIVLVLLAGVALVGPMLKQTETVERPLPTAITQLDVENDVGDVRVRVAEPGESPKVTSTVEWGLREPTSSVDVSGSTATLRGQCPQGFITVCSTDWLVVVPEGTAIDIEQGVGAVGVEEATGELDIEAGVGDVEVSEARSQEIDIELGVGSVRVESVEPPRGMHVRVGVGDLSVRLPDTVAYDIETDGGAGEVNNALGSTPGADRRIHLETGVGSLTVEP